MCPKTGTCPTSVWIPSGNSTQLWKITVFNGKIHYQWPFSIAMLIYQRVNLEMPSGDRIIELLRIGMYSLIRLDTCKWTYREIRKTGIRFCGGNQQLVISWGCLSNAAKWLVTWRGGKSQANSACQTSVRHNKFPTNHHHLGKPLCKYCRWPVFFAQMVILLSQLVWAASISIL